MKCLACCVCLASLAGHAHGADEPPADHPVTSLRGLQTEHEGGKKDALGLEYASKEGGFFINAWLRGQFRYSNPFDQDPLQYEDFDDAPGGEFEIRRARLKVEGHLINEKIGYYFEHELTGNHPLLDLRLDLDLGNDLLMRIGQYKVLYNRERTDSSGKQQFVERSVATYAFTLDRQRGITVAKHWAKGTHKANWLMAGVFDGDGRDYQQRSDHAMFVARWQWEFLGRKLGFSQGDLKSSESPAATLSFGASTVRGPYTRFSSSGGGQLDGFETGGEDRYTLRQALEEYAWHYRGMSIQQEFHYKEITDHETSQESTLVGGLVQFGKSWPFMLLDKPRDWELAGRYALVDWHTPGADRLQKEISAAANLFLRGHDHKLTAEVSRVSLDFEGAPSRHDYRYRLQWDVSF